MAKTFYAYAYSRVGTIQYKLTLVLTSRYARKNISFPGKIFRRRIYVRVRLYDEATQKVSSTFCVTWNTQQQKSLFQSLVEVEDGSHERNTVAELQGLLGSSSL